MPANHNSILALDVGTVRIGVALADTVARLPRPLVTLSATDNFAEALQQIINDEGVTALVIGLPRGLDGQSTDQTRLVEASAADWPRVFGLPLYFQDEALSSARAKEELQARAKPYQKGKVDALAATFILEDYLLANPVAA